MKPTPAAARMTCLIGVLPVAVQAPQSSTVVLQWDSTVLQAIRDTKPVPPMVARDLAIVHTCMFDAWEAYDRTAVGTRLGEALRPPQAEWTTRWQAKGAAASAVQRSNDAAALRFAGSHLGGSSSVRSGIREENE